ncbi:MAG: lactose transporter permease [Herbinix sp.]|jgi:lactose/L-arabinose transport system permease protein|nr:lactose transporter permease [Herbinix sp.]
MFKKNRIVFVAWSMVLLASAFVLIFSYIPMIQAFFLSLQTGKGANLSFNGLANYKRMIGDDTFWTTIGNTLFYSVVQIPIMLLLSLILAVTLNDPRLKGRGIYRTCIFLPCVTSLVSYSILFKNIFAVDGFVNNLLIKINIIDAPIAFVLEAGWAKVVIIIALIWRYTGYYMIFYLSALQNIEGSIYEAARLDGCNAIQSFTKVTVPLLKPIVFLTSVMALNSTLQLFDEVVNLTGGGPGNSTRTISEYIYDLSFNFVPSYGYAAAVSYAVFFIVAIITIIQKGVLKER